MDQANGLIHLFVNDTRQHIVMLQTQIRQLIIQKKDSVDISTCLAELENAYIAFESETR